MYNEQQMNIAFDRDIEPLLEERKRFLQESIVDRIQVTKSF